MKRPDRIWPRYTKEDVPYGMVQMASLGDLLGVATPMCHAIVTILSVAEHVNYWEIGRTAEKLGLVGLSAAEIIAYVRSGHRGGNAP
jgi:opine dehydrogenase